MAIAMSVLKGQSSSKPYALVVLMLGLFAIIITGVLISPPDAVHGLNHDYHVDWQQRVTKQKSSSVHNVPVYFTGAVLSISFGSCLKEKGCNVPGADIHSPVLASIQTWRLML